MQLSERVVHIREDGGCRPGFTYCGHKYEREGLSTISLRHFIEQGAHVEQLPMCQKCRNSVIDPSIIGR